MRIPIDTHINFPPISSKGQFPRPQSCSLASMYKHQWESSMCGVMEMEMDVLPKMYEIQPIQVAGSYKLSAPHRIPPPSSPSPSSILLLHLPNNPIPPGEASKAGSFS